MVTIGATRNRPSTFRTEAPKTLAVHPECVARAFDYLVVIHARVSSLEEPKARAMADSLAIVIDGIIAERMPIVDVCLGYSDRLCLAHT